MRHTARPLNPAENVICISQSAIPGNGKKQKALVERLAMRGFILAVAVRGGLELHNLKGARREIVLKSFKAKGLEFEERNDGSDTIYVDKPIHPPGHGYEEDDKAWLNLVNADISTPQHTNDPQAVQRFMEIAAQTGHRTLGRIIENFYKVEIEMGNTPEESKAEIIGRETPAIIVVDIIRKAREYFGGHLVATLYKKIDGTGGIREDGLMATSKPDGIHQRHFASVDGDAARRKTAQTSVERPGPAPINRSERGGAPAL